MITVSGYFQMTHTKTSAHYLGVIVNSSRVVEVEFISVFQKGKMNKCFLPTMNTSDKTVWFQTNESWHLKQ